MVHLVVHLVEEAKLGGPVHYRWMFPIERYLGLLKSYVRNKACSEGSIVEGYLMQEILTFCSRGRIQNTKVDKKVHRGFVHWFANRIANNLNDIRGSNDEDVLISLAQGPFDQARRFTAYNVNGFKFRTLERDESLETQNSGVFGTFGTRSYSSNSDTQMRFGRVPCYGKLIDIIEVFYNGFMVPLFKCEWANTTNPRGMRTDKLGFTSINFTRLIHTGEHEDDEPYIKASEAQLVYYVDDEKEKGWSIPVHLKPRDLYDMGVNDEEIMPSNEAYPPQNLEQFFPDDTTHIQLARVAIDDDFQSSSENENVEDDNENMVL
ncbi:hypothetical protein RIF29_26445 [Crotalaria pallida]|uniref:DUF4218 domain-containing protein n=1 Tax=Crotalaria pallida TaxID=3830 RepID=A0AAN9ENP3_CROPI